MLDIIKKWWNRKWSDWEFIRYIYSYDSVLPGARPYKATALFKSTSNDGLVRYKRKKAW